METASGSRLKRLILRLAFYAAAFIVVLAALWALVFTLARPKLLAVAERELRKNGAEARSLDMSLLGTVRAYDLTAPLKQGGALRIGEIAARPPLHFLGRTWLGGSGNIYNLRLEKSGAAVFIPRLSFSGVSLEDKDPAIASRSLQMLLRLRAGGLYADKVALDFSRGAAAGAAGMQAGGGAGLHAVLHNFAVTGLNQGKIAQISYSGMDSGAALAGGENAGSASGAGRRSDMHSGAFQAANIDAAALYALARSLAPAEPGNAEHKAAFPAGARELIGAVQLSNVNIDAEDARLGSIHIAAGALRGGSLALKGQKSLSDFITELPAAPAGGEDKAAAKKRIMLHNLRGLLADMAAVDLSAADINIAVKPGPELLAARAAAEAREAKAAAKQAAHLKTVGDILAAEQNGAAAEDSTAGEADNDNSGAADNVDAEAEAEAEAAAPAAGGSGGHLGHLPLQFELTLKAFDLRANQWQQAIPHNFYVKVKDLTYFPGPNNNGLLQALREMGHQNLQFSLLGDIAWNPANSELSLNRLAFYGRDMGGFSLKGTFLDVPQSVFDGRPEAVNAALNQAGIENMEIWLQDSGFIHNLVQWGTTEINISANELQTDLHDIAVKSPPLLFHNRQEAQDFAKIFGSFVDNSGTIRITVSAPQQGGLKFADIMNSQDDLSVLLNQLHMTIDRPAQPPQIE